ncbi:MAG: recombinase family protein [Pseudohongiellaceae bacterium]
MAVYSYSRTSEIESLHSEGHLDLDTVLENESLHLQTFALSQGMRIDERFFDRKVKWNMPFLDRPEGTRLLNTLEAGDIVIANNLLRIFSSCQEMSKVLKSFIKMQVRLYIVDLGGDITDDNFQIPFSRIARLFTRLEKRRSTERIKTVKDSQRKKGRFLGGSRPFGYMIHSNGRLIENPMEQRVLKKIIDMKNQGKSLRAISAEVSTPMVPVSFKTVQRLLKRHANGQLESVSTVSRSA